MEHKCNFSLWKNNKYLEARGVTLTADMAEQLLSTGKMQVNNLTSKAGNLYNAIFYMEPGEQYVNFRMEFAPRNAASPAPSEPPAQTETTHKETAYKKEAVQP